MYVDIVKPTFDDRPLPPYFDLFVLANEIVINIIDIKLNK